MLQTGFSGTIIYLQVSSYIHLTLTLQKTPLLFHPAGGDPSIFQGKYLFFFEAKYLGYTNICCVMEFTYYL